MKCIHINYSQINMKCGGFWTLSRTFFFKQQKKRFEWLCHKARMSHHIVTQSNEQEIRNSETSTTEKLKPSSNLE